MNSEVKPVRTKKMTQRQKHDLTLCQFLENNDEASNAFLAVAGAGVGVGGVQWQRRAAC